MNNNILNTVLNGISKSLNIASNVIPICKDTYPLIKKGKNLLNKNNIINKNPKIDNKINNMNNENNENNENKQKKNLSNNPKFFV